MKITEINFGKNYNPRVQRYCKELGLSTVKEVIDYPIHDLAKIKGFGRKSFTAIQCTFIDIGIINEITFR